MNTISLSDLIRCAKPVNPRFKDLTDCHFVRLTVQRYLGKRVTSKTEHYWQCACICGATVYVSGTNLRNKHVNSCGCLRAEASATKATKHGQAAHGVRSRVYQIWQNMKNRCFNESDDAYKDYGGRGITVFPEWLVFEKFYAAVGDPPGRKSLDRINVNGNYEPGNVRWATQLVQCRNKRNNVRLTFKGQIRCLSEWAELYNLKDGTVRYRLKQGWSISEALLTPLLR